MRASGSVAPPEAVRLRWTHSRGATRAWNWQTPKEHYFAVDHGFLRWFDRPGGQLEGELELRAVRQVIGKRAGTATLLCGALLDPSVSVYKLMAAGGADGGKLEAARQWDSFEAQLRAEVSGRRREGGGGGGGRLGEEAGADADGFERVGGTELHGRALACAVGSRHRQPVYVQLAERWQAGSEMGELRLAERTARSAAPADDGWLAFRTGAKAFRLKRALATTGGGGGAVVEMEVWREAEVGASGALTRLERLLHVQKQVAEGRPITLVLHLLTSLAVDQLTSFLDVHMRHVVPRHLHPSPGLTGLCQPKGE